MSQIYTLFFVLSLIMLIQLISSYRSRITVYYMLLFVAVMISNFGYMQLATAQNLTAAVYANQTTYLGASFSPFFLIMCLADLCKTQVKKGYRVLFLTLGIASFVLTSTTGMTDWYYKSIDIAQVHGLTYLVKEYGPLHTIYPLYLALTMLVGFVMILRAMKRKKDVSYVTSSLLLALMIFIDGIYVLEKTMHLKLELIPLAYIFAQTGVLFLLRRISLYDVTSITTDSMARGDTYGFLICDFQGNFLGADEVAKKWFPELNELAIDVKVTNESTSFLKQLGDWIRRMDERELVYIEQDSRIIEAKHTILVDKRKRTIHCVYLRDDTRQQEYMKLVEQYNENLEHDVAKKTQKLRQIQNDIIVSMASIVENRDSNTGGHIARTSDVVRIFVNYLREHDLAPEMTPEMAECIIKAAPLHDFGKIGVPDVILNKPGKFTDEEYEQMKTHSAKGAVIVDQMLQNSDDIMFRTIAVNVAHYHHEKWDGRGYPEGISGTDIPFEARVMALADVFDALVSKRVYKDSYSYDKAFSIIEESCGSHFDPNLCKEFLKCRSQFEELYNRYTD